MTKRRVVVTGLGLITPVGIGVAESWANIINGQSGIGKITKFDCSAFPSQVAGEVKNFDPLAYIPPKDARRMDTFIQFGIAAGIEASIMMSLGTCKLVMPLSESTIASAGRSA